MQEAEGVPHVLAHDRSRVITAIVSLQKNLNDGINLRASKKLSSLDLDDSQRSGSALERSPPVTSGFLVLFRYWNTAYREDRKRRTIQEFLLLVLHHFWNLFWAQRCNHLGGPHFGCLARSASVVLMDFPNLNLDCRMSNLFSSS